MNIFFYTTLFLFGTLFGSFASVLIYRLKSGEKGIIGGRSHCQDCDKILKVKDLIPILSRAWNKGKCSKCQSKISLLYPLLEISMGIVFALIGYFLIDFEILLQGNIKEIIKLIFWLFLGFITVVYSYYDILFLEIHEGVLLSGIGVTLLILIIQTLAPEWNIIENMPIMKESINIGMISSLIGIAIIFGFYTIMVKELSEVWDIGILIGIIGVLYVFHFIFEVSLHSIPILNGMIGAIGIFLFFFLQIVISKGKRIGGGDLRIGIFIGLLLGTSLGIAGLMLTYFIGSVISILYIMVFKYKHGLKSQFQSQIPFGPFLALGFLTSIFGQNEIQNFIEIYFGMM